MMKWLRKKPRYQGPDQLAAILRRGMGGRLEVTSQEVADQQEFQELRTRWLAAHPPKLQVPSVVDSIPVFIPPRGGVL